MCRVSLLSSYRTHFDRKHGFYLFVFTVNNSNKCFFIFQCFDIHLQPQNLKGLDFFVPAIPRWPSNSIVFVVVVTSRIHWGQTIPSA